MKKDEDFSRWIEELRNLTKEQKEEISKVIDFSFDELMVRLSILQNTEESNLSRTYINNVFLNMVKALDCLRGLDNQVNKKFPYYLYEQEFMSINRGLVRYFIFKIEDHGEEIYDGCISDENVKGFFRLANTVNYVSILVNGRKKSKVFCFEIKEEIDVAIREKRFTILIDFKKFRKISKLVKL